jgi:ATP-binding cassette subfamily B multidrug efflux pump
MWHYAMRHKWLLLLDFICIFGFIIVELGLPTILGRIVNQGIANNDFGFVGSQAVLMLLITIVGVSMSIGLSYFVAKITTNIVQEVRDDLFAKIQTFGHLEFENLGVSSLITRTTNDAYQIMLFLGMILRMGFLTPMMFIMSIIMIMKSAPSLSVYVWACLPILLVTMVIIARITEPISQRQQKNLDAINKILRENLSGLRVIRAFVNEKFESKRFNKVNDDYANSSKSMFRLMAVADPGFSLLFNFAIAVIVWQAAKQIGAGTLSVGSLIAFIDYIFHTLISFMLFANVFMMYPRANVSAKRIQEVLDTKPSITDNANGVTQTATEGIVEFRDVTFAYADNAESPVIENVSFTAKPGETVAFIGSTGSGKSTLIQLLPRFYDVTGGSILIDGVDVREYQLKALREKMGYIPQKAMLFTGTIADNLRYGKPDATEEEMRKACEIAQALEFIEEKPKKFQEPISEGGSNFSGGQKQRLAIARAIIRDPAIYIFDDSFSALDARTDALLRERLKNVTKKSTVLIVAQKISTIMNADKIIVLDEGKIVESGTHKELIAVDGIYRAIAMSQLSEEELDND